MNRQLKWRILLVIFALISATHLSAQTFADLKSPGSGRMETNCLHTFSSGCTISGTGTTAPGTSVGAASFILRLDTGSPTMLNGVGSPQGICIPAAGTVRLSETGGDVLDFNTVGMVCEESSQSDPFHFDGTYRIIGGTGRFTNAVGTGSVSAAFTREGTFTRGAGDALIHLNGFIKN